MAIEHLFSHLPELEHMFVPDLSLPSKFKRFQGDKVNFAKNIVPAIPSEHFEVFRPMFEFIRNECEKVMLVKT